MSSYLRKMKPAGPATAAPVKPAVEKETPRAAAAPRKFAPPSPKPAPAKAKAPAAKTPRKFVPSAAPVKPASAPRPNPTIVPIATPKNLIRKPAAQGTAPAAPVKPAVEEQKAKPALPAAHPEAPFVPVLVLEIDEEGMNRHLSGADKHAEIKDEGELSIYRRNTSAPTDLSIMPDEPRRAADEPRGDGVYVMRGDEPFFVLTGADTDEKPEPKGWLSRTLGRLFGG
jgi:hypothetical protein